MHQRKHPNLATRWKRRALAQGIALILLLQTTVTGTLAFLTDRTQSIKNLFQPSQVTTAVEETFQDGVKTDVKIKNTGDVDAWLRGKVVITWQDEAGNVYSVAPKGGTDYTITYDESTWLQGDDGFWYYPTPVEAGESTKVALISRCELSKAPTTPEGYSLCVEILSSGLQSKPASVFNENWGKSSGLEVSGNPDEANYGLATKKGGS